MPHSPMSLPLARIAADGHANAGLHQFNELQRHITERGGTDTSQIFHERVALGISAATNLSLSLEIMLKLLRYQHHGKFTIEHDLTKLYDDLSPNSQQQLRDVYSTKFAENFPFKAETFSVSTSMTPGDLGTVATPDVATFSAAIAHTRSSYVSWRYIYERFDEPKHSIIHFKSLLCMIEAAHAAIDRFDGNASVQL